MNVAVSIFENVARPDVADVRRGTWQDFVESLKTPLAATIPKKDLPLWSPAQFDGRRAIETVRDIWAHVLDVDEAPIPNAAELREALAGLRAVCYSSSSATAASPRWRVAIALSRAVTADEYVRIAGAVISQLSFKVGSASRDPARQWYFSRLGADGHFECFSTEGEPLDVETLLEMAQRLEPAASPAAEVTTAQGSTSLRHAAAAMLGAAWPPKGKRCDARLALSGALFRSGYSEADAIEMMDAVHDHVVDRGDVTLEKIATIVHDTRAKATNADAKIAGWPALERSGVPAAVVTAARGLLDEHATFRAGVELECFPSKDAAPESGVHPAAAATDAKPRLLSIKWGGWDEPFVRPPYLLDGLIPKGKVTTFFAEGGSVKSWSVFALAISVATGAPWLGRYPVTKGRALILDYEDGREEFLRRKEILVRRSPGLDLSNLGYQYAPASLDNPELWKELAEQPGLDLVLVDALNSGMPSDADENDQKFSVGMKLGGRFTEATGGNVLFVHHANRQGAMRGSSTIRDQSDVVFKFEPVSETDSIKRMRMVCDKPGPQKRPAPVNVELSDDGLRTFEDDATDIARNADGKKDVRAAVLLALRDGPMLLEDLQARLHVNRQKLIDAIKALKEGGEIVSVSRYKGWQLDDAAKRRARILAAAPTCHGTKAALRDAAHVLDEDVRAAFDDQAVVFRTGIDGGGFVVVDHSSVLGARS